jgi:hypothetical protein
MHERKAALILALVAAAAVPRIAGAADSTDAATKAREGDVNHWIEYYRKSRPEAAATVRATPADGNGKDNPAAGKSAGQKTETGNKDK